ncbi:MAG: AAA family ATPase [Oscillospiraceae bacterium]|nr:AAA family ATPase [Oscillospiraceae bacterium]
MQYDESNVRECPVIFMDQVERQETEWLWYPYIPRGKLTIIQGDPGEGKSTFALYLAACLTRGTTVEQPRLSEHAPQLVCYQNAEDGLADTIKPRLEKAGADCRLVLCADDSADPIEIADGRIEMIMREFHPALMILDPMQAYLGSFVDMHRANEVRPVMSCLASLAEKYHCAVILIGHLNKASKIKSLYRGLGSIDLTAAARSVLLIARDPAHPENRVLMQIKNSLAEEAAPAAFSLDSDGKVQWLGAYEITLDEIMNQNPKAPTRRDQAAELIQEMLAETGSASAHSIYAAAKERGLSQNALARAKQMLGIRTCKTPEGWFWAGSARIQ